MKLLVVYLTVAVSCGSSLPADMPLQLLPFGKQSSGDLAVNGAPPVQSTVNINGNVTIQINDNRQACCNQENNKPVTPERPKIPDGYVITSESDEYITAIKFHSTEQNWNDARKTCRQEGGFLAYANSKEQEDSYLKMMEGKQLVGLWVGIHDYFQVGDFTTVLGEDAKEVAYITWYPGEPDHLKDERCLHYWRINGKQGMNDIACNTKFAFNCQIKLRKN